MSNEPKLFGQVIDDAFSASFDSAASDEREAQWRKQRDDFERRQREMHRERALAAVRGQLTSDTFRALVRDESLAATDSLAVVRSWLAGPNASPVLVLSGPTGCGKTVAMAYALAELGGTWVTCTRLTRLSAANFGDEAEEYERTLRARALCVDDAGTERMPPEAVTSMLVELLEKRQSLRTVITTNLSSTDFAKRYRDDRLMSRIQRVRWVPCKGEDMRRAK